MHGQNDSTSELLDWRAERLQPGTTNVIMESALILNIGCKEEYDGLLQLCATTIAQYTIESGDGVYQNMLSKADYHLKAQFRHLVENCKNLLEESIGAETGIMKMQKLEEKFKESQTTQPESDLPIDQGRSDLAQPKRPSLGEVSEVSEYSSDNEQSYFSGRYSGEVQPILGNIQNNQISMMMGPRPAPERFPESRMVHTEATDTVVHRSDRPPGTSSLTLNTASIRRNPMDHLILNPKVVKPRPPH